MKKLFEDTRLMDKAVREKFGLSDDIMMENAAAALEYQMFNYTSGDDAKKLCEIGM